MGIKSSPGIPLRIGIASALREQFGVRCLRVFGWLAQGSAGPVSDGDVVIDFQAPASAKRFCRPIIEADAISI
jgi:predicted nucleotidyltransferase